MKITKLFLVMLISITVAACGGGGSSSGGSVAVITGTAAQYFTKIAVGNKWSYNDYSPAGTDVVTITSSSSTAAVLSDIVNASYTVTDTVQIDGTGALVLNSTTILLPPTFSVGTTWNAGLFGTGTIVAFNVTRTVPGGTFTDCLEVTYVLSGVTTTTYYSPSVGGYYVDTHSSAGWSRILQSGYIANP